MKRSLIEYVLVEIFADGSSTQTTFRKENRRAAFRALHTSRADWVTFEYVYGPLP